MQPDGRLHVREKHLQSLWQAYTGHPVARQADKWLAAYFREHKGYGKNDRRWYSEQFFGWLRTAIAQLPVDRAVDAASAWLALRHLEPGSPAIDGDDLHNAGLPGCWKAWLTDSSLPLEKRPAFIGHLATKPPLYLRVNYPERLDAIEAELAQAGFAVDLLRHNERWITLAIKGDLPVYELACLKQGLVEIQDLASQHLGAAVDAHPGMAVWDVCAGGGGKTMQIAAQMQNRGVLYASDIRDYKLDELKLRARRAGFHNIRRFVFDGTQAQPEAGEGKGTHEHTATREIANSGGFHRILVDAPCTSSGTLRRNPDVRFRIMPGDPEKFAVLQLQILHSACTALRPGGKLIYSTCSVFRAENEAVVAAFIGNHPGFRLLESKLVGSPDLDADTMYYAILTTP